MPLHIDDDPETALIELAAIFEQAGGHFTGQQVSKALRNIAARLHECRKEVARLEREWENQGR